MTIGGRLAALFPTFHIALILGAVYQLILSPSLGSALIVPFAIYGVPLLLFRVHNLLFPLVEGVTDLGKREYSPWWTSYQLQLIFIAVPALESVLHMVPGLFSIWLRLWGSKVGKQILWTPKVEIVDRSLVEIGDRVVVGHLAAMCAHVVTPVDGRASLIVQKIRIGHRAVIGGMVGLGPGSDVKEGELVKFGTKLYWKGTLS